MNINIKKGHNIRISGLAAGSFTTAATPREVGLVPADFRGIKPKLLVKTGDQVQLGSALFFDKNSPLVKYPSPAGGTVADIVYGERRVIRKIIIKLDDTEPIARQEPLALESADRQQIVEYILKANLWPLLRQKPFGKTADPEITPDAIFVSGIDTTPLAIDPAIALEGREEAFRAGMLALTKLSGGAVNLTIGQSTPALFQDLPGVTLHHIHGPHPAGNVGIQIHHIDHLKPGRNYWTVTPQQVAALGRLFITGQFDPTVAIAVAGPAVKQPTLVKTRMGTPISHLVSANLKYDQQRLISGDVLTGRLAEEIDFLGFYHTTVSGLRVDRERPFLGWARLGSARKNYSLTNAYLRLGKPDFAFSTRRNGGHRGVVPINAWEDVLPMDIIPVALYKAILANDVEEMEQLGILECDPEDFALAAFACPSKTELTATIRRGLEIMEKEV